MQMVSAWGRIEVYFPSVRILRNLFACAAHAHLMQLCGSLTQSVLHLKRSHASQPIGGVRARPFSSPCTDGGGRRNAASSSDSGKLRRDDDQDV